jgi:hypothetical protein
VTATAGEEELDEAEKCIMAPVNAMGAKET